MPERIQLSRRKGWRKPENTLVVSRPARLGNPFTVEEWGLERSLCLFRNTARANWNPSALSQDEPDAVWDRAYELHQAWLKRLGWHPLELLRTCRGMNMACWCPLDQPCHADILLELANP